MKFLRNKNAPPLVGLVQEFIDTAYDTVKLVADNLDLVIAVGEAIEAGELDQFLSAADIDTLAKLNAFVLDAQLASEAYVNATVDAAVVDVYKHKGGYDADTNTPDLITSPNVIETAWTYQVTVGGIFFTAVVDVGDQITANQDDPSLESHWTILNRNIDETAFATAEQGAKADTATQPADNISTLTNDAAYADDQTPAEIVAAFTTVIPAASQAEAEAGTEVLLRQWSPLLIAQAIAAQAALIGHDHDGVYSLLGHTHSPSIDPIIIDAATLTLLESHNGQTLIFENTDCAVTIPNGLTINFQCILGWATGQPTATPVTDLINGLSAAVTPAEAWKKVHIEKYGIAKWFATF